MLFFLSKEWMELQVLLQRQRTELDTKMRKALGPEAFDKWKQEQETERRHRELCQAIRDAGRSARSIFR